MKKKNQKSKILKSEERLQRRREVKKHIARKTWT